MLRGSLNPFFPQVPSYGSPLRRITRFRGWSFPKGMLEYEICHVLVLAGLAAQGPLIGQDF
jgi:hypothetical protein